ncbi:MAG: hypothetical protein ACK4UO_08405 [Pseudolabrys sp.]
MIEFTRQPSGLYLEAGQTRATARVAFLFQDAGRTDPTFQLTAQSWIDPGTLGYVAFFVPSATRDWSAFAATLRAAFTAHQGSQIGWFPEPLTLPPTLVFVSGQGTASPVQSQPFSLVFRQSVTFQVRPDLFGSAPTVLFDDATNSIQLGNLQQVPNIFVLNATLPAGPTLGFATTSPFTALPMTGPYVGTASCAFQLGAADLAQFEAGMMYFSPPSDGGQVGALGYPVFRAPGGANRPFNFNVTLDMLAPLDPARTFFQFTDALVGSNFVTANGKSFAFKTVNGDPTAASRLVFAGRPLQSPTDQNYFYLTPAGRFGLTLDGADAAALPASAQMLCGVTGTEFLTVQLGAAPDALEFVSNQPAWRIPPAADSQTNPVYLDGTATTSYGRIVSTAGGYVSQPERAPLYKQAGADAAKLNGEPPASGLNVHILDYFPIDSWLASQEAPPTPLAPYAGVPFATDPNLKLDQYLDMESNALNPKRANLYVSAPPPAKAALQAAAAEPQKAMTPQGMIAEVSGTPAVWNGLEMAISQAGLLRFEDMGPSIRKAVQQNQIFTVISTKPSTPDPLAPSQPLFSFADCNLEIGDWTFDMRPGVLPGPDGTPPIFIMKFYPDESIADLVDDTRLWSQPDTFNTTFSPADTQAYLQKVIADAKEAVFHGGTEPDKDSLYWNFYQTVTDPAFNGILAVNCTMRLDKLPPAIKAVLGGMKDPGIAGLRVHHAGVAINNTDPSAGTPTLQRSAMFALVDYEKTPDPKPKLQGAELDFDYDFEVDYLRSLFTNSELRSFSCKINLTINNLFKTDVNRENGDGEQAADGDGDNNNTITIMGSYQAHGTSGDESNSGEGVYSFVAEGNFVYDFTDKDGNPNNKYLKKITLSKLQFSFDQETSLDPPQPGTTRIKSHFGIWGNIEFAELKVLDVFSFEKLEFSDLGIDVGFDLTVYDPASGKQPSTSNLLLSFAPGNLRLDLGSTEERQGDSSLTRLIPFKLKSFLYSQHADETIESLNYYSLGSIPGLKDNGITLQNRFDYALIFDLDLGSMGGLVGSLSAFKFSILMGWLSGENGGLAVGVQLPQVDGKLEIKIQGVLTISIEQFNLVYATDSTPKMLVLGMNNCFVELFGTRIPPKGMVSFGLFAPTEGADQIGWIGAYNLGEDGGGGEGKDGGGGDAKMLAHGRTVLPPVRARGRVAADDDGKDGEGDDGGVFELIYVGLGQRVGPDPADPPKSFGDFLEYMQTTFWEKLKNKEYGDIYHPDGKWIIVTDFKLLKIIEIGLVFYDVTPFYALQVKLTGGIGKGFEFEITYTKVTDTIGLFATTIGLPASLRTFNVGAASLTLPTLSIDVYTNGNWKVDLGFPDGDNWSVCFRVEAQAGPVPVTGSGGFYIAYLSSATDPDVFKGEYQTIEAFGFAARLGVGKDFTAGPLKAGVSVTFFGIIQGAAGYLTSGGTDLVRSPDALSLQGQFGIIGELYGSLDFVIIKASVNVRLQASIGIVLTYEPKVPGGGDGSILLYIQASVSVSVSVEINLFLFSVTISFSFEASFRFDWQLVGQSEAKVSLLAGYVSQRLLATPPALGLLPGLKADLPLLYLPELTVLFPKAPATGTPWAVVSLGVQYEEAPKPQPAYADFKPFEAVATQLATFALMHALDLPSYDSVVWQDGDPTTGRIGLKDTDSAPELLTGWIDYPTVIAQLGNFKGTVAVPTQSTHATVFPMPPFLNIATTGRTLNGQPADFSYQFQAQNSVPLSYLQQVDTYFNQLFVNQQQNPPSARMLLETTAPLTQEIFLDFFKGLIRGAVHQLLVTMQNQDLESARLTDLFSAIAGAPSPTAQSLYQQLAGQMSSALRGGLRLPYTAGMTVPGGPAAQTTNALFALLWQEFPVGGFAKGNAYSIALTNPDKTQGWLTANASFSLTATQVAPYTNLTESSVAQPGSPTAIPLTSTGPQAFAFDIAIVWQPPAGAPFSLRTFPTALARLQAGQGTSGIPVLVKQRAADGAYLPDGTPLPAADVAFATAINLTVKQVPGETQGSVLADVFALSGASQSDEATLGAILADLRAGDRPVASIQILYQSAANAPGLFSATVDPSQVFVLRTNTTSVSQPPQGFMAIDTPLPQGVAVAATSAIGDDGGYSFIQIVQQATVTNAAGYYLRFTDTGGRSLPGELFVKGVGQVTLLVSYAPGSGSNQPGSPLTIAPYHNAVALSNTQSSLVYYAETASADLETRYVKVAAGTFGVSLSRAGSTTLLRSTPRLAAAVGAEAEAGITRKQALTQLRAAGLDGDALHGALVEMGAAPAQLNALYALVAYQVNASAGFIASNLSAPLQPQRPDNDDPDSDYRVFAPLYNVAIANVGNPNPNRYASIAQPFSLAFFTNDAFGNQLPTPGGFSASNLYFDPIVPLDQWMGVVPSFDFGGPDKPKPNTINVRLTPSQSTFAGMSADQRQAALADFRTIADQITAPGVSFYVETSLALQADGRSLVQFPLSAADTRKVAGMVAGIVAWLSGTGPFPGPVTISMAVGGPGTPPPLFEIAVLFGIQRDPNLISPYLKDAYGTILFPPAQNVAATVAPDTGSTSVPSNGNARQTSDNGINAFAADFVAAFPAYKLAVGMNGTQSSPPQLLSSTAKARRALKRLKLANDGTGGARAGAQSIWAAAAAMLDIAIGVGAQAGPRFLSPKPLDNALNSATVPLPKMPPALKQLPASRLFVDVDLDQLNRAFFQAVDDVLGPESAAQAFEQAPDAYTAIARGRETLAQKYSTYEVDWLFGAQSPFTGTTGQLKTARDVFEQQMRAALMTAYSVDTIVQYDVVWKQPVPAAADGYIELFGQVEAMLEGAFAWSGTTLTATTANAQALSTGDRVLMVFTATSGTAPPNGVYTVTVTDDTHFTILVPGGSGGGTFAGTRQNAGLSTAHVAISSQGPSPLTFLYGDPDVADRATVPFDLRFSITNLQYFLAPPGAPGEARPSLWLQLIDPYPAGMPHIGPAGALTTIPVVYRQYPTPPTLVSQSWANFAPTPSGNPIADEADWSYLYTYQAFLAAQDQINSAITYNTDLSSASGGSSNRKALAADDGPYDLFTALARASAVTDVIAPTLQKLADPAWAAAIGAFANCVVEVTRNTDWNPPLGLAAWRALANITDNYVITDQREDGGSTQAIALAWPQEQGESSFPGVTLSLTALDPAGNLAPYPSQQLKRFPDHIAVTVQNAPMGALGVAHLIEVDALNVLAAENALAAVQVERNLIALKAPDGSTWQTVPEFVYKTPQVRPSQPVTPYIDNAMPIDAATLPGRGASAACPPSPKSLCQRIYTIMANLLADPTQSAALCEAHRKSDVTSGTTRRVKVGCSFRFAVPSAAGAAYDDKSIAPLVPIVLARSFDIDGQDMAQLGDFSAMFANAVAGWADDNGVAFGADATPAGAMLVFDITLYAALSGVDTPVLRFGDLRLKLTDIDPT